MHIWAPPKTLRDYCWVRAVSVGSAMRGENITCLLLQLLCQPGENKCVCSSCGSSSLFPVSLAHTLATLGSVNSAHSEIQQENWHCEQDQQYKSVHWAIFFSFGCTSNGMQHLSSSTRYWIHAPCSGSVEFWPLDFWGSPWAMFLSCSKLEKVTIQITID